MAVDPANSANPQAQPQEGPSDQELLLRLLQGEQEAIQTLMERYQRHLETYVARLLPSSDLAQDISQEVFLKLLDAPPERLMNGLLGPWLFRVGRNLALDRLRHAKFEVSSGTPVDLPANPQEEDATDPLARLMASSDAERLRRLQAELPEELRIVVEDRMDRGLSFQEIASREGIPLGTALWRLHHALEILRRKWLAES